MRIYVNEIKVDDNQVKCYTDETTEGMNPTEHMIVDSDNHAFVYMLDSGENYNYLLFVEETWTMLHENFDKEIIVNDHLVLTSFKEEMEFLLDNIADNHNYGKEFVASVEEAFELNKAE
ncbi:hypothetical protein [Mammaliicoccus stepanovicii]|uniref:Uncharacterized protein n=1 Tax=Mammaliicoccus stepanovicii TaxID=643214 RepID=A0A239ZSK0_9STAP|nr:hypothetical protein [Mammaliicoccus stepanovicii]PNZ77088.1 hypothetical protein CD111_05240 [Mammaliicoccus stepanovicii]GGI38823.1 UPF0738 protein [Mammaliicoccus stepanovicii]SNV73977.1 Uncharacterised protein [Mammaliicoccus stepanovicii]